MLQSDATPFHLYRRVYAKQQRRVCDACRLQPCAATWRPDMDVFSSYAAAESLRRVGSTMCTSCFTGPPPSPVNSIRPSFGAAYSASLASKSSARAGSSAATFVSHRPTFAEFFSSTTRTVSLNSMVTLFGMPGLLPAPDLLPPLLIDATYHLIGFDSFSNNQTREIVLLGPV